MTLKVWPPTVTTVDEPACKDIIEPPRTTLLGPTTTTTPLAVVVVGMAWRVIGVGVVGVEVGVGIAVGVGVGGVKGANDKLVTVDLTSPTSVPAP